jgi:hypothetical protein
MGYVLREKLNRREMIAASLVLLYIVSAGIVASANPVVSFADIL